MFFFVLYVLFFPSPCLIILVRDLEGMKVEEGVFIGRFGGGGGGGVGGGGGGGGVGVGWGGVGGGLGGGG